MESFYSVLEYAWGVAFWEYVALTAIAVSFVMFLESYIDARADDALEQIVGSVLIGAGAGVVVYVILKGAYIVITIFEAYVLPYL